MATEYSLTIEHDSTQAVVKVFIFRNLLSMTQEGVTSVFSHLLTECFKEMIGLPDNSLLGLAFSIYPVDMVYSASRTQFIRESFDTQLQDIQWRIPGGGHHAYCKGDADMLLILHYLFQTRVTFYDRPIKLAYNATVEFRPI